MTTLIRHIYKHHPSSGGILYAWFMSMHTRVDIIICADADEQQLITVADDIHTAVTDLEQAGNCYNEESTLALLNRMCGTMPLTVDNDDLYELLRISLISYHRTAGCFDITVHSACHDADTINKVCLSEQDHSLYFARPGIVLNLSGIIKGYALEKIRTVLKKHNIDNALLNMGNSSVMAIGNHPLSEGWTVGFSRPSCIGKNISLHNECLTTSGNATQERSHIINPHTGRAIKGQRQVAVVTNSGIDGEILSTALFAANSVQREQICKTYQPRMILEI